MTLILELSPKTEELLRATAAAKGQDIQEYILDLLEREIEEEAEDREIAAMAAQRLAGGDLSDCYTLDELRTAVRGNANGHKS